MATRGCIHQSAPSAGVGLIRVLSSGEQLYQLQDVIPGGRPDKGSDPWLRQIGIIVDPSYRLAGWVAMSPKMRVGDFVDGKLSLLFCEWSGLRIVGDNSRATGKGDGYRYEGAIGDRPGVRTAE